MRRTLFTFAAAVSAVLCVAFGALWVRTYYATDSLTWHGGHSAGRVETREAWPGAHTDPGVLAVSVHYPEIGQRTDPGRLTHEAFDPGIWAYSRAMFDRWRGTLIGRLGFGYVPMETVDGTGNIGSATYKYYVPCWFLVSATALLPAVGLVSARSRRRRRRAGRCRSCGYDLRATPGRCPECGAVPAGAKGAT